MAVGLDEAEGVNARLGAVEARDLVHLFRREVIVIGEKADHIGLKCQSGAQRLRMIGSALGDEAIKRGQRRGDSIRCRWRESAINERLRAAVISNDLKAGRGRQSLEA